MVVDDLFFYNECIVILWVFRLEVLDCIYCGYFGISECCVRVCMIVWWLGLFGLMEDKLNCVLYV